MSDEELERTFNTNVYAYVRLARAALPHMKPGAIIATSSETGILGSEKLPDYSATKGAINAFTKALAQSLSRKAFASMRSRPVRCGHRSIRPTKAAARGCREVRGESPDGAPAQPEEFAPAYVFLASDADSSYITGTVLQVMGGETSGG